MNYIFASEKVGFGPLTEKLLEKYARWLNDFQNTQYLIPTLRKVFTQNEIEELFQKYISNDNQIWFTIYELKSENAIGFCRLKVEGLDQRGSLAILIGKRDLWGMGFGSDATFLLIDYGFTVLNLETIHLNVMENNKRARQVFQKTGFKENGRQRKFMKLNGEFFDRIWMDVLREEFLEKYESVITKNYL